MRYKTCVSVAAKTPASMAASLKRALKVSEYAELRLDFLRPSQVPAALDMAGRGLRRCVCTLRPRGQGGMFSGTEAERVSILKLVSEYGPYMMDIEAESMSRNAGLARYVRASGTPVLVSWHDFAGTPGTAALESRLRRMSKISENVKIVTTAKRPEDSARVLSLYGKRGRTRLIAFAMGEGGRASRILCLHLGSPYTYVSLGRPVAPGQFGVRQIKALEKLGN